MADEIVPAGGAPVASAAPPEAAAAPIVAAPAVADVPAVETPAVVPTSEMPSLLESFTKPVEEKPAEVAAALEAEKPVEEKPAETAAEEKPAETPAAEKPAEEKPVEPVKPAEGEKPIEAAPIEPVAPVPHEYKYEIPEGLDIPEDMRGKMHAAFDEFRADPDKGAQSLLTLHTDALRQLQERDRQDQHREFNETRAGWQREVRDDPEIGKNRYDTSMKAIARVRDVLISSHKPGSEEYAADAKAFDQYLRITGAGDNPIFLKMMHRAARFIDEPTPPQPGAKPAAHNGLAPGSRRERMYTHPSSSKDS